MIWLVKRGFGPGRVKEYFVGARDGDTLGAIIAGPFATWEQCYAAKDALEALCNSSRLICLAGHLAAKDR
jgi:hypothetical protein